MNNISDLNVEGVPLVTVILPVYNQERYIAETINSVLIQTYTDFELLIIDDGSSDSSAEIIKRLAAKDKRIRAFYGSNAGRCNATNSLVDKAIGKWCAFLDADDVMLPNRLEKQLSYHLSNHEIDASSCHCFYINDKGTIVGEQRYPFLKTIEDYKKSRARNEFVQCAYTGLFISRKAFLDAGGLVSRYWPCDDFEFFNRLIEKNYLLIIYQEVLMKYRIHPHSITVKEPLYTFDVIGYVMNCINHRRSGEPEIDLKDFIALRANDPWWIKLKRRRYNYAQIYFRNAGISMMSKRYLLFSGQLFIASFLSPAYVFSKARNLAKRRM
jgi:glycosyltransferase involved in cell wall biosynthesis